MREYLMFSNRIENVSFRIRLIENAKVSCAKQLFGGSTLFMQMLHLHSLPIYRHLRQPD